jgi:archaemetzincin
MDTLRTYLDGIELMKPESMPAMAYYAPRKRYRADSLIHWMARRAAAGETWLGITEQDISTTKEGNPDYGIMGLGFRPGKAAVASNYRLRKKDQFYKVAIHELGHTLGLPHCGDESCYMRDAEGGDPTAHEKYFCTACQAFLKKKGWKR